MQAWQAIILALIVVFAASANDMSSEFVAILLGGIAFLALAHYLAAKEQVKSGGQ